MVKVTIANSELGPYSEIQAHWTRLDMQSISYSLCKVWQLRTAVVRKIRASKTHQVWILMASNVREIKRITFRLISALNRTIIYDYMHIVPYIFYVVVTHLNLNCYDINSLKAMTRHEFSRARLTVLTSFLQRHVRHRVLQRVCVLHIGFPKVMSSTFYPSARSQTFWTHHFPS